MSAEWLIDVAAVLFNNLILYIWKPWTNAYTGEKGKNLARKEDLDKILNEVRAITATQKEIEATISGELWNRQWKLNQKLEIYSRILRAISDYVVWLTDLSDGIKLKTGRTTTKQVEAIAEDFYSAHAVAPLFLSPESIAIVESLRLTFYFHSSQASGDDYDGSQADKTVEKLENARGLLVASSKKDLLKETEWTSPGSRIS